MSPTPFVQFLGYGKSYFLTFSVAQKPIYLPSMSRIWASRAGNEPKTIKITGRKIRWKNTATFFHLLTVLGTGGSNIMLKMADIIIPSKEMVIMRLVRMGKLNDKIVKLNLFPPKNSGSQPKTNSSKAAVAHDQ